MAALLSSMRLLAKGGSHSDRMGNAKRALQILDTVYEESDFGGRYWELAAICTAEMARCYAKDNDQHRAMLCLSKAAECVGEVTALPLSDHSFIEGTPAVPGSPVRPLREQMRQDLLRDPVFAPLSGTGAYQNLSDLLSDQT